MRPMIKWAGGKRGEIPFLRPHYPENFARIIEPFAGGAAVAWDLDGVPAIINDINQGLISFYRAMQDEATRVQIRKDLEVINARRKHIRKWVGELDSTQVVRFYDDPQGWVADHHGDLTSPATLRVLDGRAEALLVKHGKSKAARIRKIEQTREPFPVEELRTHLETAIHSAFYETLREVYNGQLEVPPAWSVAAWWVVRVLCYSGMFRFSRKGMFNVPYGGISYNARDFASSYEDLFGQERVAQLARFTIEKMDFQELFAKYQGFGPQDFIFIDPPYDTAFSQYNSEGDFTGNDQARLRDTLLASNAKWMVVIKRTDFIESLYAGHAHCYVFDKTYSANFRNRHERGVEHLVATNYPLVIEEGHALRPLV